MSSIGVNRECFILPSTNILVNGYCRSCVMKLSESDFTFIPNALLEILIMFDNLSLCQIKAKYSNQHDIIIDEYFNYLEEMKLIFPIGFQSEHRATRFKENVSSDISLDNAIIEIGKTTKTQLLSIISELSYFNCEHVMLIAGSEILYPEICTFLKSFDNTSIRSLELVIPWNGENVESIVSLFFLSQIRLFKIYIYCANENSMKYYDELKQKRYYLSKMISLSKSKLAFHANFTVNKKMFIDSVSGNNCFTKKVVINKYGDVKKCLYSNVKFGSIKDNSLSHIIKSIKFFNYMNLSKDNVDICKDCEFRYMCLDCRFRAVSENEYSRPSFCNYNPYIAKWQNEEGWISVEKWREENPDWEEQAIELRELNKKYIGANE